MDLNKNLTSAEYHIGYNTLTAVASGGLVTSRYGRALLRRSSGLRNHEIVEASIRVRLSSPDCLRQNKNECLSGIAICGVPSSFSRSHLLIRNHSDLSSYS